MATEIQCSTCKRIFSSHESYQNHLPCHGSEILGGAGQYAKEGTGRP